MIYKDEDYKVFSVDKEWGAFGMFHTEHAVMAILGYGSSCGFFGNAGYVLSLIFFSPVIVSASFLLEPFIGQLVGYWTGIDHFPGWATWVGTTVACLGVLFIQKADRQRKND